MTRIALIIQLLALAAVASLSAHNLSAENVKVKVTGVKNDSGRIMIAAGNESDRSNMVSTMTSASSKNVEVTMDIPAGSHRIYVFHDENGNMNLDRDSAGKPTEGCYMGSIEVDENTKLIEVKLRYYLHENETSDK